MPLRIAIISSPRSGNTWTRLVLARALNLQEIAVHNWTDLPGELPTDCIVQIHWYREPNFQSFLRENKFRLIVLARHPLDVFLSMLHFVRYEPMTARWLEGNCAIPPELIDSSPASAAFSRYATSWGAENLLSISYQWWHDPSALRIRYEELVRDPKGKFTAIAKVFDRTTERIETILQENNLENFRSMPNRHGWRGQPGLWQQLIPTTTALRVYAYHCRVFNALGYPIPLSLITRAVAKRNWERLRSN
ncbi:MAG: sulfotransferase domain-containing protein [Verrucomicrobia bacterium]|nr:sulfotransferase domain-containing protein [Verrucomicrobiota bacterium]